jgi:hypothetical protein
MVNQREVLKVNLRILLIFGTDLYPFSPQDSDIFECEVFLGHPSEFPRRLGATVGVPILIKSGSIDCATLPGVNSERDFCQGRRVSLTLIFS